MTAMTVSLNETEAHRPPRTTMTGPATTIRTATLADRPRIVALQHQSLRTLGRGFYTDVEIESYLRYTPTLEEYLVEDSTYYVAEAGDVLVGCGGWSVKAPAYGAVTGDPFHGRVRPLPKVRAMFVHPSFARRGIGRQLLAAIESAIVAAGYDEAGLVATLGGALLYERCGYVSIGEMQGTLPDGSRVRFVCMYKSLASARAPDTEPRR
jgi:GNAT superfamily N-acetyltransferase